MKNNKRKDKLPGGLADKKQPSDFDSQALKQGIKVELEHTDDKDLALEIAMDHLTEDPQYYTKLKTIEKSNFIKNIIKKLTKGGMGSGRRPTDLNPGVSGLQHEVELDRIQSILDREEQRARERIKEQERKRKEERQKRMAKSGEGSRGGKVVGHTKSGKPIYDSSQREKTSSQKPNKEQPKYHSVSLGIIEGQTTQSGKPILLDFNSAKDHGYTMEDHRDAANFHYEFKNKLEQLIKQRQEAKVTSKISDEARKVLKLHNNLFMKHQSTYSRMVDKINKSLIMADAQGSAIETGDFSLDQEGASEKHKVLLETIRNVMSDFQYGDEPKAIVIDKGMLFLSKTDEGLYSGYVDLDSNVTEEHGYESTVMVEKQTIPTLIQFLSAKELIFPETEPSKSSIERIIQPEESKIISILDKITSFLTNR